MGTGYTDKIARRQTKQNSLQSQLQSSQQKLKKAARLWKQKKKLQNSKRKESISNTEMGGGGISQLVVASGRRLSTTCNRNVDNTRREKYA